AERRRPRGGPRGPGRLSRDEAGIDRGIVMEPRDEAASVKREWLERTVEEGKNWRRAADVRIHTGCQPPAAPSAADSPGGRRSVPVASRGRQLNALSVRSYVSAEKRAAAVSLLRGHHPPVVRLELSSPRLRIPQLLCDQATVYWHRIASDKRRSVRT